MAERRKRISPYLEWAVLTEFAYLPGEWFWVLLELDGPAEALARSVVRSGLDRFIQNSRGLSGGATLAERCRSNMLYGDCEA